MSRKKRPTGLVPLGAQAPMKKAEPVAPSTAIQLSVGKFEQLLGGRDVLVETLASAADLAPEIAPILGLLGDPANASLSLARICQLAKITPGQIFKAFEIAARTRAGILVTLHATSEVPAIVKEITRQALPHEEPCATCNGIGTFVPEPTKEKPNPTPEPCRTCNGRGSLRQPADLDRQTLALELTGLIKKGGGINVAVQNNMPAAQPAAFQDGFFEQLQQAVSAVLYGDKPPAVAEGEVVDEP